MKNPNIQLWLAIISLSLSACTTQPKDIAGLNAKIDAAYQGHYGQAQLHEELAEENQKKAVQVLKHWQKDQYWNIEEQQKALDAAKLAAEHRHESEHQQCLWLADLHGRHQQHQHSPLQAVAYFKTASAKLDQRNHDGLENVAHLLQAHPDATAMVIASTDTVGSIASNQLLSERRAEVVKHLLISHGARAEQISVQAIGKGHGPDNTSDQNNRVANVTLNLPPLPVHHIDCTKIK